jgi:hypothetical protein
MRWRRASECFFFVVHAVIGFIHFMDKSTKPSFCKVFRSTDWISLGETHIEDKCSIDPVDVDQRKRKLNPITKTNTDRRAFHEKGAHAKQSLPHLQLIVGFGLCEGWRKCVCVYCLILMRSPTTTVDCQFHFPEMLSVVDPYSCQMESNPGARKTNEATRFFSPRRTAVYEYECFHPTQSSSNHLRFIYSFFILLSESVSSPPPSTNLIFVQLIDYTLMMMIFTIHAQHRKHNNSFVQH